MASKQHTKAYYASLISSVKLRWTTDQNLSSKIRLELLID